MGTSVVSYQYWLTDSPTVQTVTFSQKWYYTDKDKLWKVYDDGFGAITKTMVGF